ncbi:hypothetical protein CTEN210_02612 [Chaetoceros tenuissimus]|uniref:Uncharacterized protein n=1 Tax=Chaetoceros tenuissimus TaxID=426638 RepID=A0AAD3CI98_9STRA|nr:hypothetical protein CTEN210_02612 [Chaetoceros tenuissimus]
MKTAPPSPKYIINTFHKSKIRYEYPEDDGSVSVASAASSVVRGSNYLFELMFYNRWDEATERVREKGHYGRKWKRLPQFMNCPEDSQALPIHYALSKADVPLSLIEALIFAYPESIQKRETANRRGCLHIAIKSGVKNEIISYLLKLHPEGARIIDGMGRVPLMYAISNGRSFSLISEIVKVCPEAVCSQDYSGWSPLHVVAGTLPKIPVAELLLSVSESIINMTTKQGSTPLIIAQENDTSKYREDIVQFLSKAQKSFERNPLVKNFREAEKSQKNLLLTFQDATFV